MIYTVLKIDEIWKQCQLQIGDIEGYDLTILTEHLCLVKAACLVETIVFMPHDLCTHKSTFQF